MAPFSISTVIVANGAIGIGPMPGRTGELAQDIDAIADSGATLVITMTPLDELRAAGAGDLPQLLANRDIKWLNIPVADFTAPDAATQILWQATAPFAHQTLAQGGRVFIHCFGGCGRSGMAALRLLCELGQNPDAALTSLRAARPCAVETADQMKWATT